MINYINSDNILVFPSSRRSDNQITARYLQEETFSEIIKWLADYNNGSFILTKPQSIDNKLFYDGSKEFEFMIHGYWFKLNELLLLFNLFPDSLTIYAYIDLDKFILNSLTNETRLELIGRDIEVDGATNQYTGVKFTDDIYSETDTRFVLPLFSRLKTSDLWNNSVVVNNLIKISNISLELDIDGGVIKR